MSAKLVTHLRHIAWRSGRPRFSPGPALRARGLRGFDLRHADGAWYSEGECVDWLRRELSSRLAALKAGAAPPPGRHAFPLRPVYSLGHMFEELWARPEFSGAAVADGRRRRRPLAARTVSWYRAMAELVAREHEAAWAAPATRLTTRQWERLVEEVERRHGLDTARAVRATLSMAFGRMKPPGMAGNPLAGVKLPMPEPRLRVGEIADMEHLIAVADRLGRPEIGDCIMLGLMTGQRQADRLNLTGGQLQEGGILFRQQKTGALVEVAATPQLERRLAAMRQRRGAAAVAWPQLVIDERCGRPWARGGDHYRHVFAAVVAAATAERPALAGFRDQDLRDTAVTWLANAGASVPEIIAITGHSEQSAGHILRHYLARHPDQARAAMGKLVAWLERKGARL